uniref:NADH-ubiquinone oxidoreductase chain 4 n=1 Tax=Polygraphus poligraphus TaxID=516982 RepID=A0A8F4WEN7_9CUCU|nr:NADH dehydrogenase subunit 4 [Polygraphus poligraphus]QXG82906.1 NADH dehydrogenase subunit 4 [Polygraphus poligraphus]UJX85656.1 NADH dehydrogenase subunit 4 [Polygraphus poligraphus]
MMALLVAGLFSISCINFVNFWFLPYIIAVFSLFFFFQMPGFISFSSLSFNLGLDLISFLMVVLSFWICLLMIMASSSSILFMKNFISFFSFTMMILLISLFLAFSSLNLFMFYLFFEVSLVPTLFLILGWGNQPERLMAGIYLLFYTLLMSLPMMISLFYMNVIFSSLELYFLTTFSASWWFFLCSSMVFFVKIPMFMIHLWLPKAHVEAPISGSMILAGVMLKLGGYGMIRVLKIFSFIGVSLSFFIISLSMVGAMIVSILCLRQSDMKLLIAYSSVSHMGLVLAALMSLSTWSIYGSCVLMVAHGLSSSGLFCLANFMYERLGSRSLFLNKGLQNIFPSLTLWWFLLCSSSMAAPPSLNLVGELVLINSLNVYSSLTLVCSFFLVFSSAVYTLFLFSFTQHGKLFSGLYSVLTISVGEFLLIFLHWVPLNLFILKLEMFY